MQGGSPQPCRRRHFQAQAGGPHRRARREALRHAVEGGRARSDTVMNYITGRRERGCGMDGIVLGDTLDSFRQKRFLTAERRAKGSELAAVSAVLLTTLPPRVARWG